MLLRLTPLAFMKNVTSKSESISMNLVELFDPKEDFIFKRIFGYDEEIFISFANSALNYSDDKKIISVTFLNNEINKTAENDKESRLDVHAILKDGSHINIEMQIQNTGEYEKRSLYYWAKLYEMQLMEGEDYKNLSPAICIHVLNFNLFKQKKNFHTVLAVVDLETKDIFSKDFEIHFMELPKVAKKMYNTLDKWMHFLKNPSKEEVNAMGDKTISKALDTLEYLSQDPVTRAQYEARKKYRLDYNTSIRVAKEEGIHIGEERGEYNKAIEIARAMRKLGLPLEVVRQTTGLSYDEIEKN